MKKVYLLSMVLLLFLSCSDKNYGVELNDDLVPYFELFKKEAALRGVDFDNNKEKIEGYIQNLNVSGVAGVCRRNDGDFNRSILIDKSYWNQADDLKREYVVFHELGHCFLLRDHVDSPDSTGTCISIMYSGTGGCNIDYTASNRDYYLDELFR